MVVECMSLAISAGLSRTDEFRPGGGDEDPGGGDNDVVDTRCTMKITFRTPSNSLDESNRRTVWRLLSLVS